MYVWLVKVENKVNPLDGSVQILYEGFEVYEEAINFINKTDTDPDVWTSSVLGKFVRNGRYIVEEGSSSAHCCFEYTVLDTEANNRPICETFCLTDANLVAEALNKLEK